MKSQGDKQKKVEYEGNTCWTGYYSLYRLVGSFNPNDKSGALRCAFCHKDVTRLGDKRIRNHMEKHEQKN